MMLNARQRLDLENIRVCVILPVCEWGTGGRSSKRISSGVNSSSSGKSGHLAYESTIDSTCFAKPLISFTLNSFEKIPWIRRIVLCSTTNRQEQVQEILQEYSTDSHERIKYICAPNMSMSNGNSGSSSSNNGSNHYYNHHHPGHNNQHPVENTFNRLLKFSMNCLKREDEPYDIIIVHDVQLPYVEEEIIYEITIEALKHGAASLSTSDVISNNFLFRFDESNVDNPENSPNFMKKGFLRSVSMNSATISDFLNTSNYRIGFKPQSFQYSIFEVIFNNCTNDELDNDVDCVVLVKKYADITTKLLIEKSSVSNYSKRMCCISHYLKENHKQAIILSSKSNEDSHYLQAMLRVNNWNTEICSSLDKSALFKINELINCRNVTDGISLVKFCETLADLNEFSLEFAMDAASKIEDEIADETSNPSPMDERRSPATLGVTNGGIPSSSSSSSNGEKDVAMRRAQQVLHHVVFVIKLDVVNSSAMSPQETIRNVWKKNQPMNSSNIWSLAVIYEFMNAKVVDLINYVLTDRQEAMNNLILEVI